MSYRDQRGFTDSQDNQKDFNEKYIDSNSGPFLATVKYVNDPQKMGRLGVNIPALTHTKNPTAKQITWCQYLSPFYGVKSLAGVNGQDPYGYKSSQSSYGMWAIPPDIDTSVLVIFAKGDGGRPTAFWMGCVQEPFTNQQIPAHGSTTKTAMPASGGDFSESKKDVYGTDLLPAGEKNRKFTDVAVQFEQQKFPINERLADQLTNQGLVTDTVRGTTTSSARRESPSAVFGISTPGRISENSAEPRIGLDGTPVKVDRDSGHTFVMDDGAEDGTNQLTRLRTASGHQLLMHDTEGVVYLANGSGKAFIEMEKNGKINIYSDRGIAIRSEGDFNLHSDQNINFHAKEKINFTAEKNVVLNAHEYVYTMGEKGVLTSAEKGSVRHFGKDGITSFTDGVQLHGAKGRIDLAGSQVHFNSVSAKTIWGPSWLKPSNNKIDLTPIKATDIVAQEPLAAGKPNTVKVDTTVMDSKTNRVSGAFVTHEPYDRTASAGRDKDDIA